MLYVRSRAYEGGWGMGDWVWIGRDCDVPLGRYRAEQRRAATPGCLAVCIRAVTGLTPLENPDA